jgi:hypothetical protein
VYSWRLHGSGEAALCRPLGRGSHRRVGASERPGLVVVAFARSETCPAAATVVARTERLISRPVLSVLGGKSANGTFSPREHESASIDMATWPLPRPLTFVLQFQSNLVSTVLSYLSNMWPFFPNFKANVHMAD